MLRLFTPPMARSVFTRSKKHVKFAAKQCFFTVEPRVVYSTNELLSPTNELLSATSKNVLPASQNSNMIYPFSCYCDSRYEGRPSERLQDRIKQHVFKSIRSFSSSQKRILTVSANLPLSLMPSLLLLLQPLNFIFYKILPALNIMMTVDFYYCHRRLSVPSICFQSHFHKNF